MKRRPRATNDADRAQLEAEAMAELQREAGSSRPAGPGRSASRGGSAASTRSSSGGDRAPAWGAPSTPSQPAVPEPQPGRPWRSRQEPTVGLPTGGDDEVADEEAWNDEGEEWADDEAEWDDDDLGAEGQPIRLLGVPLDYDATSIALEQLASRSNVRQPAAMVMGVDASEAERVRAQAMNQFLERQKVRSREDAERAAARAAANPGLAAPRAPFPPLSPGLSAKSLVMQPVAAPPLNLPGATTLAPELVDRAEAEASARAKPSKASASGRPAAPRSPAATKRGTSAAKPARASKAGTSAAKSARQAKATAAATSPPRPAKVATSVKPARSAEAGRTGRARTDAAAVPIPEAAGAVKAPRAARKRTPATAPPTGEAAATTVQAPRKAGTARKVTTRKAAGPTTVAPAEKAPAEKAPAKKAPARKVVAKARPPAEPPEDAPGPAPVRDPNRIVRRSGAPSTVRRRGAR